MKALKHYTNILLKNKLTTLTFFILAIIIVFLLALISCKKSDGVLADYEPPSGTTPVDEEPAAYECSSPYIAISSKEDLAKIGVEESHPLDGNYCLTQDITDLGDGLNPLGGTGQTFTGTFDGAFKEIATLSFTTTSTTEMLGGLVYNISSSGVIKNLTIRLGNISGPKIHAGGVAYQNSGLIEKVRVLDGQIGNSIGPLGCLVSRQYGSIKESYSNCTLTNYSSSGGIPLSGGLVGLAFSDSLIEDSFHSGIVNSNEISAGFVGSFLQPATITTSYTRSTITKGMIKGRIGGIVESAMPTLNDVYYDSSINAGLGIIGEWYEGSPPPTTGIKKEDIKSDSFNNFNPNIWILEAGNWPKLKWTDGLSDDRIDY